MTNSFFDTFLAWLDAYLASDQARTTFAALAVLLSIVSLVITLREKRREKRQSLVKALQGERESVAFVAYRLYQNPKLPRGSTADEIIAALCLAWMFESSDRARAIVLAALRALQPRHAKRIQSVREHLGGIADAYAGIPDTDIRRGYERLEQLDHALS
jgi:hypothetical protein